MVRVLCAGASMPELQHFSLYAFMLPPVPHTVPYHYVGFSSQVPFYETVLLYQNHLITLVFVMCHSVKTLCSECFFLIHVSNKPKLVNCATGRIVLVAHGFEQLKVFLLNKLFSKLSCCLSIK